MPSRSRRRPARPSPWLAAWLVRIASVLAAIALWQVLTANDVRLWLRFDTLPTVTEIVVGVRRTGSAPRTTGSTSGSR